MEIYTTCSQKVLSGVPTTLSLTLWSVVLALVLGILLSFGVLSRLVPVRVFFSVICSFLKGIPILIFLYAFHTAIDSIMGGLDNMFGFYTYDIRKPPTYIFAVFALALSYAPYMCDMITSAMHTIPKGQWEACDAAGFTGWQKMSRIIIPQCIVIAIPNFGNHFVNLLKASSLSCMVTIMEMMGEARNYATMSQKFLECYIVCALWYWFIFVVFEQAFRVIEKRTGRYLQPGIPVLKRKRRRFHMAEQQRGILEEAK
ncbi:MAG: amino acid ABC transporter permease [Lachnospiraceae bacterium]|nr:amino acid ABC transporter permease [Lachnospiraceae bacterium]